MPYSYSTSSTSAPGPSPPPRQSAPTPGETPSSKLNPVYGTGSTSIADLKCWIDKIEVLKVRKGIKKSNWAKYILQLHIADPIRLALERIRLIICKRIGRDVRWTWDLLKKTLTEAQAQIEDV